MSGDRLPPDADGAAVPEDDDGAHVDAMSVVEAEVEAVAYADPQQARPAIAPDTIGSAPPPNRRAGRQRFLVVYLRVALVVAFVVGVLELILPEETRDEAAIVMVVVFVAAPIGRILWLMVRWVRIGDWRFALVGAALLGVVATGFLVR